MSSPLTRNIKITVHPQYVPEQSNPEQNHYLFAYHIRIKNEGTETAQLISRHWIITDGEGKVEEVRGPGVVGEQPTLGPNGEFEYSSYCPLSTPVGTMHGSYQMVTSEGEQFDVTIPPFKLATQEITFH